MTDTVKLESVKRWFLHQPFLQTQKLDDDFINNRQKGETNKKSSFSNEQEHQSFTFLFLVMFLVYQSSMKLN